MDLMERFSNAGVVPVVVLEDAGQALSTARALLAGGIDVMEITFRTDAARDADPNRCGTVSGHAGGSGYRVLGGAVQAGGRGRSSVYCFSRL